MELADKIKEPLQLGVVYLVPCIVRYEEKKWYITPVINHPHNDVENGQIETHYHVDYRFVKHKNDSPFPWVVNKHSKHYFVESLRPVKTLSHKLEYFALPMVNEDFTGITSPSFIANSKLKHKCIHKGKCPHRGYDLSQVKPKDGVITCPLHGLQFNAETKQLLTKI
jgi:hypothetical protein